MCTTFRTRCAICFGAVKGKVEGYDESAVVKQRESGYSLEGARIIAQRFRGEWVHSGTCLDQAKETADFRNVKVGDTVVTHNGESIRVATVQAVRGKTFQVAGRTYSMAFGTAPGCAPLKRIATPADIERVRQQEEADADARRRQAELEAKLKELNEEMPPACSVHQRPGQTGRWDVIIEGLTDQQVRDLAAILRQHYGRE